MSFLTWDDAMRPRLTYMRDTVNDMLQRTVRSTTDTLLPYLRAVTPVGQHFDFDGTMHPGGQLRNSLYWQVGELGAMLHGAEQGVFVAGGTAPHEIRPSTKSALAFYWPRVGGGVVRKRVMHPGTAKNDFRQKGVEAAFNGMAVQETILRIVSQWASGEDS